LPPAFVCLFSWARVIRSAKESRRYGASELFPLPELFLSDKSSTFAGLLPSLLRSEHDPHSQSHAISLCASLSVSTVLSSIAQENSSCIVPQLSLSRLSHSSLHLTLPVSQFHSQFHCQSSVVSLASQLTNFATSQTTSHQLPTNTQLSTITQLPTYRQTTSTSTRRVAT
jgi:hypothetical protein